MEVIQIPINEIIPYKNNPRKHSDKSIEIVVKSISKYGFLNPIILDDKNIIVSGHTRLKAAIKLGLTEVPCVYTENLTEEQIKGFRIMDNKSHEYSEWDYKLLGEELHELEDSEVFNFTGFDVTEITQIWEGEVNNTNITSYNKKNIFKHICPNCGFEFEETINKNKTTN